MIRFWLIIAFLLGPSVLGQAAQRILPGEALYPALQTYADTTRSQSFDEVRQSQSFKAGTPILGFQSANFWVRIQIENPGPERLPVVLEDQWALTDHIDIHQLLPDGTQKHYVRGHKEASYPGQHLHRFPYVALDLEPGVHQFYVQYRTDDIVGSRLAVWHADDFHFYQLLSQLAYGFLMGSMFVMSIYNFFLYLSMRIPAYLYYAFYSFVFCVYQFCFSGFLSQLTGQYQWVIDEGTILFGSLSIMGVVLFTQRFLQLESYSKALHHGGWVPFLAAAVSIGLMLHDFQTSALAIISANLCVAFWIVLCAFYSTYRRIPEGKVFMMAWTVFVIGDVGTILYYTGFAEANIITQWGMIVGSVTELVMLSFGLANYVNRIRQEMHETREKLNLELAQNLSRVESQVQSKTRDIRLILQNIQQGIFTIRGEGLLVQEEHSSALLPMLGEGSVSGRTLSEIFLQKLDLDADQISQISSALVSMQAEDALSFELNAHILPRETRFLRDPNDQRILELNWEPMLNENHQIECILVTLRDVTVDRELQARTREQSEEIMIISSIVQGDPRVFGMFLKSSRVSLLRALDLFKRGVSGKGNQSELFRILHTLKGNARTEKMQKLASLIHECEGKLQTESMQVEDLKLIESELRRYQKAFDRYFAVHFNMDALSIPRDDVFKLSEFFKKEGFDKQVELVRGWLQKSLFSLSQLQSRLKDEIPRLAHELGKEPCMLHCSFENSYVNHEVFEALTDMCGHLLRNSLDHGLESAADRSQTGKTPYGHIQVTFVNGAQPSLIWRDDGRGLDLKKILEKANVHGLGLGFSAGALDEEFCLKVLTISGFTTRDSASLVSGRGVGLDAVDHRLNELGGRLQLRFIGERGDDLFQRFELVLWLPRTATRATETQPRLPRAS